MSKPRIGSIPWKASRLLIGESVYEPVRDQKTVQSTNIKGSIDTAIRDGVISGEYRVDSCIGIPRALDEKPFKFLRITRLK